MTIGPLLQANAMPLAMPILDRPAPPIAITRIAVLFDAAPGSASHPWDAARVREQVAVLMTDARLMFDYYPVRFAGSEAPAVLATAFARIAAEPRDVAPDLVLVVGGPTVNADIAVIHQVLAPCILATPIPVFTALGPDDAETILGDAACRTFPGVHAMLAAVAAITPAGRMPVEQLRQRIQSLCRFLVAQQEAESKIMLQAIILPALRGQLERQSRQLRLAGDQTHAASRLVKLRLVREEAQLEQTRARIGIELARLAQQQASVTLNAAGLARMRQLRIGMLCVFVCLIALLWVVTTLASTVFFSGCALVVGSAIYVGLSNRIIDGSTAGSSQGGMSKKRSTSPAMDSTPLQEPLFQPVDEATEEAAGMPADSLGRREPTAADHRLPTKEFHLE